MINSHKTIKDRSSQTKYFNRLAQRIDSIVFLYGVVYPKIQTTSLDRTLSLQADLGAYTKYNPNFGGVHTTLQ